MSSIITFFLRVLLHVLIHILQWHVVVVVVVVVIVVIVVAVVVVVVVVVLSHLDFRQGETLAGVLMQHPRHEVFEVFTYWRLLSEHHWIILDLAV